MKRTKQTKNGKLANNNRNLSPNPLDSAPAQASARSPRWPKRSPGGPTSPAAPPGGEQSGSIFRPPFYGNFAKPDGLFGFWDKKNIFWRPCFKTERSLCMWFGFGGLDVAFFWDNRKSKRALCMCWIRLAFLGVGNDPILSISGPRKFRPMHQPGNSIDPFQHSRHDAL